jgi:hypothetical protein
LFCKLKKNSKIDEGLKVKFISHPCTRKKYSGKLKDESYVDFHLLAHHPQRKEKFIRKLSLPPSSSPPPSSALLHPPPPLCLVSPSFSSFLQPLLPSFHVLTYYPLGTSSPCRSSQFWSQKTPKKKIPPKHYKNVPKKNLRDGKVRLISTFLSHPNRKKHLTHTEKNIQKKWLEMKVKMIPTSFPFTPPRLPVRTHVKIAKEFFCPFKTDRRCSRTKFRSSCQ